MPNDASDTTTGPMPTYGWPALIDPEGEMAGIDVPSFVPTDVHVVTAFATPLHKTLKAGSETVSTLMHGEPLVLLDDGDAEGELVACISLIDGYRGHIHPSKVAPAQNLPTHRVISRSTHIYSAPDIKSAPLARLPYGALLAGVPTDKDAKFLPLKDGGFVITKHVVGLTSAATDPVAEAAKFMGTPYLWGGRSADGIDCSGLVQVSLAACGKRVLRDSGSQFKSIGTLLPEGETPRRGDLAFFPGHVGWMVDADHILHANATHMAVTIDPLKDVVDWVSKETSKPPFSGFRRLSLAG